MVIAGERQAEGAGRHRAGQRRDDEAAGIQVEAIAAYDIKPGEPSHPKGEANGYVITLGGKRIYFAGVTECVPEVRALKNIDVAFMPMNIPVERMTPAAAAECVKAIAPKIVYVYHYDQEAAARLTNPRATPAPPAGGPRIAASVQAFKDALRGERDRGPGRALVSRALETVGRPVLSGRLPAPLTPSQAVVAKTIERRGELLRDRGARRAPRSASAPSCRRPCRRAAARSTATTGGSRRSSARARSVASMSAPANTVAMTSGRESWRSASAMPGRALPAAQPHTEFTTIISVPAVPVTAASTSAGVRSSLMPRSVSSLRIGATKNSG